MPRPALGRRPWFAFLRRALILRRLPLAMVGEGTSRSSPCFIEATTGSWSSGPLLVARSHAERRIGLRPVCGPYGLILRGSAVSGFGMMRPLRVVGVSSKGAVVGSAALHPGGTVVMLRAALMMERPPDTEPVEPGAALVLRPILGSWPAR